MRLIEIGKQYFYLTPLKVVPKPDGIKDKHRYFLCKCICGNETVVSSANIGRTIKSCGCKRFGNAITHGYASHKHYDRLYHIWNGMKFRCENPKSKDFKHYGGRGIKVSDVWRHDFMSFRAWAIEHGYQPNLTIDRINVDGNYEPDNCRWLTREDNNRTKRKKVKV